jgi:hypothetical protein
METGFPLIDEDGIFTIKGWNAQETFLASVFYDILPKN